MTKQQQGASSGEDRATAAAQSNPQAVSSEAGIPSANEVHVKMLAVISAVLKGDFAEARGLGPPYATAHALGLLADETQTRPCKMCGTPRPDFTYPRVTLAGQAYFALAQGIEARSAETVQPVRPEGREPGPKDAPESDLTNIYNHAAEVFEPLPGEE